MTKLEIIEVLEVLECPIHPHLRGDAEVRIMLPLGGVLLWLSVDKMRAIHKAIAALKAEAE